MTQVCWYLEKKILSLPWNFMAILATYFFFIIKSGIWLFLKIYSLWELMFHEEAGGMSYLESQELASASEDRMRSKGLNGNPKGMSCLKFI